MQARISQAYLAFWAKSVPSGLHGHTVQGLYTVLGPCLAKVILYGSYVDMAKYGRTQPTSNSMRQEIPCYLNWLLDR